MNYSGVLVSACPGCYDQMIAQLKGIKGVEVHQEDQEHNRCIIVIEAPDCGGEVELFKQVSSLPSVIDAALVVHHFEDSAEVNPIQDLGRLQ